MARIVTEVNDEEMVIVKRVCAKKKRSASDIVRAAFGLKPAKIGRPPVKKPRTKKE